MENVSVYIFTVLIIVLIFLLCPIVIHLYTFKRKIIESVELGIEVLKKHIDETEENTKRYYYIRGQVEMLETLKELMDKF